MSFPLPRSCSPSRLLAIFLIGALVGCAHQVELDSAQSSTENFQKAKAAGIRPVAVGDFTGERLDSPEARYLKDTLVVELQGAGLIDPASGSVIQGSQVEATMGREQGSVKARFSVTQPGGRVVYDRELRASARWSPDADAAKEHSALYRKLVGLLLTDPGFRNAAPR